MRRLRAAGYRAQITSARGLGDPEAFLFGLHGVRPLLAPGQSPLPYWSRVHKRGPNVGYLDGHVPLTATTMQEIP